MAVKPVVVKILGDSSGLDGALDKSESRLGRFGGAVGRTAAVVGTLGVAAAGAGAVAAVHFAKTGAAAEAMRNKVSTVFEDQTAAVQTWATKNNEALGITNEALAGMAAGMADLLKPMGFTAEQAAGMSMEMLDLSGALSAWSGGQRSATEVAEILSKAMLGERDSLKSLGISITEADVSARLAAKGQSELTGAALEQAKAVATQELILEKSTDAQKAWADGSQDALKAQNELRATWAEAVETLQNKLWPALNRGTQFLTGTLVPGVNQVIEVFDERGLSGVVDLAGERFSELWPTIKTRLAEFGSNMIAWLGETLPKIGAQLVEWGKAFVDWVEPQIPPLLEELRVLGARVGGWLWNTGLPLVVENLARWGAAFVDWVGPKIPPLLRELGSLLTDVAEWMWKTGLPELLKRLDEWGQEFVDWVEPRILPLLGELGKLLLELGEWAITEGIDALEKIGEDLGGAMTDKVAEMFGDLPAKIISTVGGVSFKDVFDYVRNKLEGDGEGVVVPGLGGGGGSSWDRPHVLGRTSVPIRGARTTATGSWRHLLNIAGSTGVPGVAATSIYRPGSITRSGKASYHGMGRAVDLVASNLVTLQRALQSHGPKLKELIGPVASMNWKNGRPHPYDRGIQADHQDHVHLAYDRGGWLPPGVHTVGNFTGRPEPILTSAQWGNIERAITNPAPVSFVAYIGDEEVNARIERIADGRIAANSGQMVRNVRRRRASGLA